MTRMAAILLLLLALAQPVSAAGLELAWLRDGVAVLREETPGADAETWRPLPPDLTTPLGSVWKLFVHVYLAEHGTPPPDYVCGGGEPSQEAFCCGPGGRLGADEALARSCGLFFEPARLGITAEAWRAYWSGRPLSPSASWLRDLSRLRPETVVSVASLLEALASIPPPARRASEEALLDVVLEARPSPVSALGGQVRVKTWTWDDPARPGALAGGFAGWLADGTVVWARGDGAGIHVLQRAAPPVLAAWLTAHPAAPGDADCVVVDFFARYPLRVVTTGATDAPATPGPLYGRHRLHFRNGNEIDVESDGELVLTQDAEGPVIVGRFGADEYLARVLDREARPRPTEAARALAVAIRTYLARTATREGACLRIEDSTRTQRVSPRPATAEARAAAAWTSGLVLRGVLGTYHRVDAAPNRLAWAEAVTLAAEGHTFDEILARAYPDGRLASRGTIGRVDCERLVVVERWLTTQAARWHERLRHEPGFEAPSVVSACRLEQPRPWADAERARLYVRGLGRVDDRIAVVHEYLHRAFHPHPRGRDEEFIERLARELVRIP
jgi:uncharacterized protein YfaQ (DUF2300 family)